MQTIDKTTVDAIIDELLGNNDLTASPEVWYGLHKIKNLQPEERTEKRMETHARDLISRQVAVDVLHGYFDGMLDTDTVCPADIYGLFECIQPAQPETAKRIVGKSRDGMTLWYQCDMCNEPVDEQDNYCRGCGRRLIDG